MKTSTQYFYSVARGKQREKAIKLHVERYVEVGFFKKNEKDPYQANSTYFTSQSVETEEVVGVTRLIFEKLDELPTLQNFRIFDIERIKLQQLEVIRYAELSAFTKLPAHDVALGLLKTALQYSLQIGITHWVCCVDERVYNYMNRIFKFPFRLIGDSRVYLGSTTIPCVLVLDDVLNTVREARPALYDYLVEQETRYLEVLN
ncbi:hypothetical protein [Paenibacillus sp. CF384]|uniref:N-acyl amino acid synthase FeeM domain-containing protein n=1 Tax=Paenibacillus sp. CF384 TaxID=1884382 RepID=UPI0008979B37|nr:hypothetical protein [Paenibacillus sp. CF384]SDW20803.1 hypothetical protein SAMN05518855_1001658 [Paenibacillus sp. CF384]